MRYTKRWGDMLSDAGTDPEGQLKEALDYQAKEKERLGTTLVKHHYITEGQLIDALRMQLGIDYIDLTRVDASSPELSRFVPANWQRMAMTYRCRACFKRPAASGNGGSAELHGD
ncbi:MAG: hypothetical protein ACLT76_01955 [Clostridium fessum]